VKGLLRKAGWGLALCALGAGVARASVARALPLAGAAPWGQALQAWMAANWISFGLGQMLVAVSGVLPASFIAVMAGASFGLVKGTLISATATMLGGWVAFRLSRGVLRGFVERHIGHRAAMARLNQGMAQEGWRFVMLLRVSPIMPFAVTSYALGLTSIAQRDFLLGTLATLPALIGYVALGALGQQGLVMAQGGTSLLRWGILLVGVLLLVYALGRVRRAMEKLAA